uniref:SCAN box domain-containing protein n=1 Tax=Gopherus evgoodei TaxID=1825980 RepID=A0A8C4W4U8_9SAUR
LATAVSAAMDHPTAGSDHCTTQGPYLNMALEQSKDYKQVNSDILETHCQLCRSESYPKETRTRIVLQQFREHCWKWLHLEEQSELSPRKGREWVFWHHPEMLSKVVQLMKVSVEAKRSLEAESPKASRGQKTNWRETQVVGLADHSSATIPQLSSSPDLGKILEAPASNL